VKKLLIANRGEIACRIARTARRMGIATVAVHSDADARAMHVAAADERVAIGPGPATESYLRIDRIIAAARSTGADAIHPGYGFLSENADFAAACRDAGLTFVGPSPEAMRALGGKAAAKRIAIEAGVPVVPGYQGDDQSHAILAEAAAGIGYPVMIKAVAGGGGRGMRLVERAGDFKPHLESAQREAASAFGNPAVLVEKVVVTPRHIEVQVFGDRHGNVVHLFERDCTLQRRNQKVIEEAPAPGMTAALREKITGAAVKLAKAVGYEGAGTVEFLVEGGGLGDRAKWYFIEMNTRLQVEHPVTEAITGLDLVAWQLRIAAGEPLPRAQAGIEICGHAIEARLCAEDPARNFMPSIGRIHAFELRHPEGVRLETGVRAGDSVTPYYDSMIAKLIVHEPTREAALARLERALAGTIVAGPRVNTAFLRRLAAHDDVVAMRMDTGLIARALDTLSARRVTPAEIAVAARHALAAGTPSGNPADPWSLADGFALGEERLIRRPLVIDGEPQTFALRRRPESSSGEAGAAGVRPFVAVRGGGALYVLFDGEQVEIRAPAYDAAAVEGADGDGAVRAPIIGRLAKLMVAKGESVARGQRIAVVEAMKMEHVITAPRDGTVTRIAATEGAQLTLGAVIAVVG
jgi:3-methylcrotonyl-CoA carboxylase alpha subunit